MITDTYNSELKTCSRCNTSKPVNEFHKNQGNKDGLCGRCKACLADYQKNYFQKNKQRVLQQRSTRREESRAYFAKRVRVHKTFLSDLKNKPCPDCGNRYPAFCMEFDHVLPGKRYNLAGMSNHKRELIEKELTLCEVICACCHRTRTQERQPPRAIRNKYILNRMLDFRAWMNELKSKSCTDCGQCFPPVAMDFDHVRGEKLKGISAMWSWGRETVLLELSKCDLVCVNCHRLRTEARRAPTHTHEACTMAAAA